MAWKQLVDLDLGVKVMSTWCLSLARQVCRAPAREATAHHAWIATKHKHSATEPLPDVPVVVWIGHYATYYTAEAGWETKEWGHVVVWVPGRGFISSPGAGDYPSQEWLPTLDAVVKRFGRNKQGTSTGTYLGWSEDISGVRIAINDSTTIASVSGALTEEEEMKGCTYTTKDGRRVYMLFNEQSGFCSEFGSGTKEPMSGSYINPLAQNWGTNSWPTITETHAAALKRDLALVRGSK